MIYIQDFYIKSLNFIYEKCGKHISENNKNRSMTALAFLMGVIFAIRRSEGYLPEVLRFGEIALSLMTMACLILFIIASVDRPIKRVSNRSGFIYIYIVCAVCMLIAWLLHSVGKLEINIVMISFVMPAFYLVWNNRKDYATLFKNISAGFIASMAVWLMANFIFFPHAQYFRQGNNAYMGMSANENTLAMCMSGALICSIYMFSVTKGLSKYLYIALSAVFMGTIILTTARASFLGAAVSILAWLIYYIKNYVIGKNSRENEILPLVILIVALFLSSYVTKGLMEIVGIERADAETSTETEVYAPVHSPLGDKINTLTSGRLDLWQYHIKDPKIFGADYDEYWEKAHSEGVTLDAHNSTIGITYRFGYLAGISFLLIQAFAIWFVIKAIFMRKPLPDKKIEGRRRRRDIKSSDYKSFVVLGVTMFCSAGIVESLEVMSRWMVTMIFYFSLTPMFCRECKNHARSN